MSESKGFRTGRLGRLASLGGMAARLAGGAVASGAKRVARGRDAALEELHQRTARQLLETLGGMKGLPMKVGQILSFMDGVVPPAYQGIYSQALSRLQAKGDPLPWDKIERVLTEELGQPPGEVFARIEREPIAAASIGQVYRAELPSGRAVAVKVQYPGIADAIRSDIRNVKTLVKTLQAALPHVDSDRMAHDFAQRIRDELDYSLEAQHQQAFADAWREDERVVVPEVVHELCTRRVLVTELIEGLSFAEFVQQGSPEERSEAGEVLFWFVFRSILQDGRFNADPHPGNYLFPGGGKICCLDFGCVQDYDTSAREAFADLIEATIAGQRGDALWEVISRFLQLGRDTQEPLREVIEDYLLFCFEPVTAPQPFRYTRDYTRRLSDLTLRAKMRVMRGLFRTGWRDPQREGLALLSRILFGTNSLLAALEAERDWRALLLEAAGR